MAKSIVALILFIFLVALCFAIVMLYDDIKHFITEFMGLDQSPSASPSGPSGTPPGTSPGTSPGTPPDTSPGTSSHEDGVYNPPPPQDCSGGTWSEWSECSETECGQFGIQTRQLTGEKEAKHGGKCNKQETRTCYTKDCPSPTPQNCSLGPWYDVKPAGWSHFCSKPCGGGETHQERDVRVPATPGGTCETLHRVVACNTHDCPIDCQGGWIFDGVTGSGGKHEYSYNDGICGGLYKDFKTDINMLRPGDLRRLVPQKYQVTREAKYGGNECPYKNGDTRTLTEIIKPEHNDFSSCKEDGTIAGLGCRFRYNFFLNRIDASLHDQSKCIDSQNDNSVIVSRRAV